MINIIDSLVRINSESGATAADFEAKDSKDERITDLEDALIEIAEMLVEVQNG